jgi:ABC-type Mn2+/Zn2+ transport system permease subunit
MRFLRFRKRVWLVVGAIFAGYVLSYFCARLTHALVHQVSHAGDAYFHSVVPGEGSAFSPTRFYVAGCYIAFTPLRWTEALVWHFIPRHYEF